LYWVELILPDKNKRREKSPYGDFSTSHNILKTIKTTINKIKIILLQIYSPLKQP
jgi:hypothetical protein